MPSPDPTRRFSDRVADYIRYRPGYPDELLRVVQRETGLDEASVVADVGSGTGISSALLLRAGCTVFAVEPNDPMRQAADELLGDVPGFHSVAGRAEATGLPAMSVSHVTAGQAFHWFDPERARQEFARILRPDGWVVLFWNSRQTETTPFLRGYEELLLRYATDYREVNHRNIDPAVLARLFAGGTYQAHTFSSEQSFDLQGLTGRLLSSSYAPAAGDPRHVPMLRALNDLFDEHAVDGRVRFEYDTELFFGRV